MKIRPWIVAALIAAAPTPAVAQQPTPPTPYIIGPAGAYSVQTIGSTKVEYGDGWVKISWVSDPSPNPVPPGPTPNPVPPVPPPPPAPVATGKLYVTLVYDADAETQDQATTRADLATAPEWTGLDAVFRAYASKQQAVDQLNLRGSLSTLPCLVVQELKTGAASAPVVKVVGSIASKDAAVAAVKSLRGDAR